MSWTDRLKRILINATLLVASLVVTLCGIELVLRSGLLDGLDNPRPVWIPPKYKKYEQLQPFYGENFFSFNDVVRSPEVLPNHKRIIVLGDSFVHGQGLPYEKGWTHRLESMVNDYDRRIEVLSFGVGGWATWVEKDFFEKYLVNYSPSLLIVGFCTNDPDFLDIERDMFTWQYAHVFSPVKKILPLTFDYLSAHINRFMESYIYRDVGYAPWVDKLYSDANLGKYEQLIHEFKKLCDEKSVPLFFVLLPSETNEITKNSLEKISKILARQQVAYINLFPSVYEKFSKENPRKLWAHPGDGHPGEKLSELYATNVYEYLERSKFFEVVKSHGKEIIENKNSGFSPDLKKINYIGDKFALITTINDKFVTENDDKIDVDTSIYKSSKYLYVKGKTNESVSIIRQSKVYIVVDDKKVFPTYYGPTYNRIPERTNHRWIPRAETLSEFKIHIPLEEIGKGTHKIDAYLVSPSGQINSRHDTTRTVFIY